MSYLLGNVLLVLFHKLLPDSESELLHWFLFIEHDEGLLINHNTNGHVLVLLLFPILDGDKQFVTLFLAWCFWL